MILIDRKSSIWRRWFIGCLLAAVSLPVFSQVGEHRGIFSVGGNAGYVLNRVGFTPSVPQKMHEGITAGASFRYVCEKYFNTICSVYAEVNYASMGWKEKILTSTDEPVINANGEAEQYNRHINYLQIPVFAHLAWGREERGLNFFFQAGPQFGLYLSDQINKNYDQPNLDSNSGRSNTRVDQETMPIEKKFDYGIAAGMGVELSLPRAGHFLLEARYYYGLGNIFGNTKRDVFGKSNHGAIVVKTAYLFDVSK